MPSASAFLEFALFDIPSILNVCKLLFFLSNID